MRKIADVTSARRTGFTIAITAKTAVSPQRLFTIQLGVLVPNSRPATTAASQIDHTMPLPRLYATAHAVATDSTNRITKLSIASPPSSIRGLGQSPETSSSLGAFPRAGA